MDVGPREALHHLLRVLKRWWAPAFFALIALHPVIARIRHPTLLCDDVTRVVELIEQPLGALLVRPFIEHLAPLLYELKTPDPVPTAAIDLHRLANWPTGRAARNRVAFTCPGELALHQPPRLLR